MFRYTKRASDNNVDWIMQPPFCIFPVHLPFLIIYLYNYYNYDDLFALLALLAGNNNKHQIDKMADKMIQHRHVNITTIVT